MADLTDQVNDECENDVPRARADLAGLTIEEVTRECGEWTVLHFSNGMRVMIFEDTPWVFIDPEVH